MGEELLKRLRKGRSRRGKRKYTINDKRTRKRERKWKQKELRRRKQQHQEKERGREKTIRGLVYYERQWKESVGKEMEMEVEGKL